MQFLLAWLGMPMALAAGFVKCMAAESVILSAATDAQGASMAQSKDPFPRSTIAGTRDC